MAVTVATTPWVGANPNPAYSGTFIPELWSGRLLEKFYAATVLAAISNTDYEGEIRDHGDKVIIRTKPTITIRDYQVNGPLTIDRPSSNIIEMTIDHAKYFALALDDIMEKQSDINLLSLWAEDASEQLKIAIDTEVLASIYARIDADNKGTTAGRLSNSINLGTPGAPVTLTPLNILNFIVDLGTVLDEQNIPETGRWLVLPAWAAGMIKKSDLRNASISGDGVTLLRNGRLGMIDRFTIYSSNLLPSAVEGTATANYILAGHPHGLAFASQLSKVQTIVSEMSFSQILRGLQVYGVAVLDGRSLTAIYAVRG